MTKPQGAPTKPVDCPLAGEDGNAFAIMARLDRALARAGASPEYRTAVITEMTASDYDHLLAVAFREAGGSTEEGHEIHELTQDECDALGLDGRDGAGTYVYVDLDWCTDHDPADAEAAVNAMIDEHGTRTAWARGLHVATIDPHGPAGGWPVLRFTGGIHEVRALVKAYENE
jgi:hypothetical protein